MPRNSLIAARAALALAGGLAAGLGACAPQARLATPDRSAPAVWQATAGTGVDAAGFWSRFRSDELHDLLTRARGANPDLAIALSRIDQARAQVRIARATLMPTLEAGGAVSRTRFDPGAGAKQTSNLGSVTAPLSYEIDLWGRNRASRAASRDRLRASVFDYQALDLSLSATVASGYFQALALADRLALARESLAAAREVLRIVEVRAREGLGSGLDVAQQRAEIATEEAAVVALEQARRETLHALAALVGAPATGFDVRGAGLGDLAVPVPAPVQPADLLNRRPDLRAAEARIAAANGTVAAARAAFFPSLSLTLSSAIQSTPLSAPANTTLSASSSVLAPIFSGGRLRGTLELAEAGQRELVATYRQAVLAAFREGEDALSAVAAAAQRADHLEEGARQAGRAYALARERYLAGATDYQTLLTSQQALLRARDSALQARQDRLFASVGLYQAMGGGPAPEAGSGTRDGTALP